jgi:hypothetical protein
MLSRVWFQLWWAKAIIAIFFFLSGTVVTLLVSYTALSFWYIPCAIVWALSGFVWLIRPSLAPGISVFPVLVIGVMLVPALPTLRQMDSIYWLLALCVAIALTLVAMAFRRREARNLTAIGISFSLVLIAFAVDRLFTHKVEVHSYSMSWSANGVAPWGDVQLSDKGESPVVLYRVVDQAYCYDALFSAELKHKLTESNKPVVTVEYNVFSDFGRERGYTIRAVDGLLFNAASGVVRAADGYGGYVGDGSSSNSCSR